MATDPNLLRALKATLRRKYADDIAGLKIEAARVFALALSEVTITSSNFADGAASGEITCPRGLYLQALEDIIAELDDTTARASNVAVAFFR